VIRLTRKNRKRVWENELQVDHPQAANALFALSIFPNFQRRNGAGNPMVIAKQASRVLPQPYWSLSY
jgi:hypothetical protein